MPSKKKTIIAVLAILILVGVGFSVYKQQKIKELAAVRAKCLEDTSKLSDEQLVEKINNLVVSREELSAINRKTVSYLFCNFLNSDKSEGIYEEAKALIEKLAIKTPEIKESVIKNLTDIYSAAEKDKNNTTSSSFFTKALAIEEISELCPDRLPALCLNRKRDSGASIFKEWCMNLCGDIEEYQNKPGRFNKEIIDFNEWNNDLNYMRGQYTWREAMAFRIGGREAALKVCGNLVQSEIDNCKKWIEDFESWKLPASLSKCADSRKDLQNLICEVLK